MAEFSRDGASFMVPDKITVRQQLAYYSALTDAFDEPTWVQRWRAAAVLIQDWKSESIPDPQSVDLDAEDSGLVASILVWAGSAVLRHLRDLERLPKNG